MIYGEEIIEEVRSRNDIVDITALAAEPEVMFLHF